MVRLLRQNPVAILQSLPLAQLHFALAEILPQGHCETLFSSQFLIWLV